MKATLQLQYSSIKLIYSFVSFGKEAYNIDNTLMMSLIVTSLSFLFKNSNDKFENESAVTELMESIFGANNHEMPGFLD